MDTALNIIGAIGAIIGIGFLIFFAYLIFSLIFKVFQLFMTIGSILFGVMPKEDKKKEEPKIEDVELLP